MCFDECHPPSILKISALCFYGVIIARKPPKMSFDLKIEKCEPRSRIQESSKIVLFCDNATKSAHFNIQKAVDPLNIHYCPLTKHK